MQVSVVSASMPRKAAISSRSLAASPASWPRRAACSKSKQRALVVSGTHARARFAPVAFSQLNPPSPITSMSPIMWALVIGTKRSAPKNSPTASW